MNQSRNITDEYPVETMLASSPQTSVYRATDPKTGRDVAVKLLASDGTNGETGERQHFLRAMGAVQFLRLPAFPELYDFGLTDDQGAFMVMEWVDGVNLTELQGGPPQHIIRPVIQVAEALEALSMGDVFHHNLSPTNIVVTSGTDGEAAKIIGFGTAAYLTEIAAETMLGHSPDSDPWIAPERFDPETAAKTPGAQSDIYSLALITTEMLGAKLERSSSGEPTVRLGPDLRTRLSNPEQLEEVLSGALHVAPEERTTTYPLLRLAFGAAAAELSEPSNERRSDPDPNEVTVLIPTPGASPSPPPLPGDDGVSPDSEAEIEPTPPPSVAPEFSGDETIVLSSSVDLDDTDPDLEYPAPSFDPNKTDPVFQPEKLRPPPVSTQPPPIEDSPVVVATPPKSSRKSRTVAIAIAAAVVVTLVVGGGIALLLHLANRAEAPAVAEVVLPTPIPATPTPRPTPEVALTNSALDEADALLLAGDIEGARSVLAEIPQETIDAFTEDESEIYTGIVNALTGTRLDAAISDLEGGLRHGSIRMLKRAIAGLARFQPRDYADRPGISQKLTRAQAALELHTRLWKDHEAGNHSNVLEQAATLINLLPEYSTPYTFRQESAAALENASDKAAMAGDLDEAESLLAPIRDYWPEREGLNARLSTITSSREKMETQLSIIESALTKGWDGDPAAGLEILNGVSPLPLLKPRFEKSRLLLEEQLADLDGQPPHLELSGDVKPSFKKKRTVEIELVITDDYRVTETVAFLRPKDASSFSKIPLKRAAAADHYVLEVSPEVHNGDDFSVYFEATDTSGHTARLGDPQEPLEFTRKKGLKAIFGK